MMIWLFSLTSLVQEVQCQADFRWVESGVFFGEAALPLHVEHQVSPADELDHEEEAGSSLEAGVEPHQERVVGSRLEHVFLRLNPVDILRKKKRRIKIQTFFFMAAWKNFSVVTHLVIRDQLLFDDFHGVDPPSLLEFHHEHLGVRAPTDHADQLEVIDRHHAGVVPRSIACRREE